MLPGEIVFFQRTPPSLLPTAYRSPLLVPTNIVDPSDDSAQLPGTPAVASPQPMNAVKNALNALQAMKRVLVTGSNGSAGRVAVSAIKDAGHWVRGLDRADAGGDGVYDRTASEGRYHRAPDEFVQACRHLPGER